ncbi:MAG: ABC transporter ATP-binding protein [Solirubrobacterales bacterium]
MSAPLLDIRDLRIRLAVGAGTITPVDGVDLAVQRGEILGIAGESGSGKSLTLRSILGLLPPAAQVEGELLLSPNGEAAKPFRPEEVRGRGIAMVFQEPMTALNPTMRVGDLIAEAPRIHRGLKRAAARTRAVELMHSVGIPDPQRRARMWPHQLSGGLRQRVMIATALSTEPMLLLCDEPTTALDVTIQDQILGLLEQLRRDRGTAIMLVTHDLAVIAEVCDRVAMMYAGRVVETGRVEDVFTAPQHPYTAALLASVPSFHTRIGRLEGIGGQPPDPRAFPPGCRFAPRCRFARDDCTRPDQRLRPIGRDRATACIHPEVLEASK